MQQPALLTALATGLVLAALPATAQNRETLALFAKGPHVGPVEQALAGVTTTFRGKSGEVLEVRHGCGMVLRCDGFVLFPAAMFAHRANEPDDIRPDIRIDLRLDTVPAAIGADWPVHIPKTVPLRLVKLTNVHSPALRTLLPDTLKSGDTLTLAWRRWDAAKNAFGPLEKRAVHFAGRSHEPKKPATCLLEEATADAPEGSIVLGPEGMAVGMVARGDAGEAKEFVSMDALRAVTNCVEPVPMSDADFAGLQPAPAAADTDRALAPPADEPAKSPAGAPAATVGMVRIPGGPVALVSSVLAQQDEMKGSAIACIPPFEIDKTEVTNAEYWAWWSKLPANGAESLRFRAACWPLGWTTEGPAFPQELSAVPVLGVSYFAAQSYARAQGKRLPTPYEWCLAALGPGGEQTPPDWMAQYVEDRRTAAQRIQKAHYDYLRDHVLDIDGGGFFYSGQPIPAPIPTGRRLSGFHFFDEIPWLICPEPSPLGEPLDTQPPYVWRLNDRLAVQQFSKKAVEAETDAIRQKYKDPQHVMPARTRDFDVSRFGVSDMLFNTHAYVIPPPFGRNSEYGYTLFVNWVGQPRQPSELLMYPHGTLKSTDYFPASRIRQMPLSPRVARWMQIGTHYHDVVALAYPLAGWSYEMGPEPLHEAKHVTSTMPWHDQFDVIKHEFPVWLHPEWAGSDPHKITEIAGALDIDRIAQLPDNDLATTFLFDLDVMRPVGFRCAR